MTKKTWKWIAIALLILVVLIVAIGLLGGFRWFCEKFYPPPRSAIEQVVPSALRPSLGQVQVAPGSTMEGPTRTFQLYAWYLDAHDNVISGRFDPLNWSWDPPPTGNTVLDGSVMVSDFPGSGASKGVIRAADPYDPGISGQIPVTIWANPAEATSSAGGSDVVKASHDANAVPEVVIIEPKKAGVCSWGEGVAFVGAAAVGEQEVPCSVALLSGTHKMLFLDDAAVGTTWGGPKATVDLPTSEPLELDINIYIAVTGQTASALSDARFTDTDELTSSIVDAAESMAKVDVEWANLIFEATRGGIRLKPHITKLPTSPDLTFKVGADPFDCDRARALHNQTETRTWYEPTRISVYYVDWIDYPTEELDPGSRGAQCYYLGTGNPGPVIFVSYTRHSPITLTHELGHAFALEHADLLGADNVMNSMASDGPLGPDVRSHLRVGQVFRMNVSDESWLNHGGRTIAIAQRSCGIVGRCPPVESDAP